MKYKKTFFDEDITIDEKLFDNFKIADIASWSHLELWCAIQNVEVNYDFFKGILCGTHVIEKLYDVVLDAIENTDFIDKFIDNVEVIEIIEKLYAPFRFNRTFKANEFWLELAYKQDKNLQLNYYNSGIIAENDKKYKLLNAIFTKSPFTILKFYDKSKLALHIKDIDFERWLLNKCKCLATKNNLFKRIYSAMLVEVEKQNKIAMYLN